MREHIEFIQAQTVALGRRRLVWFCSRQIKLLSNDHDDDSFSAVLRLPAGWSRREQPLAFDEEIYVLDGDLTIGGVTYPDNCYGFLAAGTQANALNALTDVTLAVFPVGQGG